MSKRLGWKETAAHLRRGHYLMVTLASEGPSYATDNGIGVSVKTGREMTTQSSLPLPNNEMIVPNEDGLFPGMSQTWRIVG